MCKIESCPCLDHEALKATFYHLNASAVITKASLPFKDIYGVLNVNKPRSNRRPPTFHKIYLG